MFMAIVPWNWASNALYHNAVSFKAGQKQTWHRVGCEQPWSPGSADRHSCRAGCSESTVGSAAHWVQSREGSRPCAPVQDTAQGASPTFPTCSFASIPCVTCIVWNTELIWIINYTVVCDPVSSSKLIKNSPWLKSLTRIARQGSSPDSGVQSSHQGSVDLNNAGSCWELGVSKLIHMYPTALLSCNITPVLNHLWLWNIIALRIKNVWVEPSIYFYNSKALIFSVLIELIIRLRSGLLTPFFNIYPAYLVHMYSSITSEYLLPFSLKKKCCCEN